MSSTNSSTTIDLNTCVPGQKLRTRDGGFRYYVGPIQTDGLPHGVHTRFRDMVWGRDHDGRVVAGNDSPEDIVEILPFETITPPSSPMPTIQSAPTKPMTAQELYLEGQRLANFKEWEKVRVAFKVPPGSGGWQANWADGMDCFIGKNCVVLGVAVNAKNGVKVCCPELDDWFHFPWFCLERITPEPIKIALNDSYTAEVTNKETFKVGCQTFPVENLRKLLSAIDAL